MSFSIELPPTYTFSLCIDRDSRPLVNTKVEVKATAEEIAKAKRTLQRLMNEYAPAIEPIQAAAPDPEQPHLIIADETGPALSPSAWAHLAQRVADRQNHQPEPVPAPPAEEKPEGARGLLRLRCPECGKNFGTYLKDPQASVPCRCGHPIDLTAPLARYRFTCPYCEKETWGLTNLEDPDITIRCKCGEDVDLHWVPKAKEYQN